MVGGLRAGGTPEATAAYVCSGWRARLVLELQRGHAPLTSAPEEERHGEDNCYTPHFKSEAAEQHQMPAGKF